MKIEMDGIDKEEAKAHWLKVSGNAENITRQERLKMIEFIRNHEGYALISPRFYEAMMMFEFALGIPHVVYFVYACICPILSIYYTNDLFICFLMFDMIVSKADTVSLGKPQECDASYHLQRG